jgi:hypothetical protein
MCISVRDEIPRRSSITGKSNLADIRIKVGLSLSPKDIRPLQRKLQFRDKRNRYNK